MSEGVVSVARMAFGFDVDPFALSLGERIVAVRDIERDIARLQARQVRLIAAIAADPCDGFPAPFLEKEMVREELRSALGESAISVANRIEVARELLNRLPVALAALSAGELTMRHARLLAEATAPLPDPAASVVEQAAVPFAAGRDLAAFTRKVRREVLKADPRSRHDQVAAALAERRMWVRPDGATQQAFSAPCFPPTGRRRCSSASTCSPTAPTPTTPATGISAAPTRWSSWASTRSTAIRPARPAAPAWVTAGQETSRSRVLADRRSTV